MADEAFALSPISARAAAPGEADYDAISAAFMETSRGRWFLSEYARRNRNADTRMVLDAVARIEQNLAAERNAAPDDRLPQALAAIRQALDEAKAAAAQASASAEASLTPIRGAAQTIQEILMRLREIGADGRIYDLMDSQVGVIEAGCGEPGPDDARAALDAAFDLIEQRIREFEGDDAVPASASETPAVASAGDDKKPAEPATASRPDDIVTPLAEAAAEDDAAQHDAVLDMIALEMAAPDFAEDATVPLYTPAPDPAEPVIVAQNSEPFPASQSPVVEPSLGASLIASGIVQTSDPSAADPLAPIRRMSQAEKIALFS
jgi:hypothetical protein